MRVATDHDPVAAKLRRLRWDLGYLTRAELGEVTPHHDPEAGWPVHDVMVLGLAPHPRETCRACQAVGT